MKYLKKIKGSLRYIAILFIAITILVSANQDERNFQISKGLNIYATLFREINMFYVDGFNPEKLIEKSINSLLETLDPYTVYYPESKIEDLELMTTGEYAGIGTLISKREDKVVVSRIYEGTPSQEVDLRVGDVILSIDGKSLKNKNISQVSSLLKGKLKTEVVLKIERLGEKRLFEKKIKRQIIQTPCLPYFSMLENQIGYIYLTSFTDKSAKEVRKALIDLRSQGAKGIILDLRSNPGGLLGQAATIVNYFISKGDTILTTKGKLEKWDKAYIANNNPILSDTPTAILINSGSASASEIVAGAIQDLDRGVIIGQKSFGKGLVQTTRELVYNAKLKVTTAKYYTPSGRCVQALDYLNRNEDGSVGKIADSLKTEYSTQNGRKVYDGGGITPDVTLPVKNYSKLAKSLIIDNVIFDFITEYLVQNEVKILPSEAKIDDKLYIAFNKYLDKTKFSYETNSDIVLKKLKEVAKKEKYYNLAHQEFENLEQKLAHSLSKDMEVFENEVKELLAAELLQREYYAKGLIQYQVNNDSQIDTAINILTDRSKYNKTLNIK